MDGEDSGNYGDIKKEIFEKFDGLKYLGERSDREADNGRHAKNKVHKRWQTGLRERVWHQADSQRISKDLWSLILYSQIKNFLNTVQAIKQAEIKTQKKPIPKYVWYSTEATRKRGIISILAIVETIFLTLLTWSVYLYFNFSHYLIYAILIMPLLLLLKTPISTKFSLLFYTYLMRTNEMPNSNWWLFARGFSIAFVVIYCLSLLWGNNMDWLDFFNLGFIYGLIGTADILIMESIFLNYGILAAIAAITGLAGILGFTTSIVVRYGMKKMPFIPTKIFIIQFYIGVGIGLFISTFILNTLSGIYAFVGKPIYTILHVPKNFREQILVNDSCHSPHLLPMCSECFSLFPLLEKEVNKTRRYVLAPFFFLAYFYRWSVKSAAWFYWPLIFLTDATLLNDSQKRKTAIDIQTEAKRKWFHIAIVLFLAPYWLRDLIEATFPNTVRFYNLAQKLEQDQLLGSLINHKSIIFIAIATVIYFIVFYFSHEQKQRRKDDNPGLSDLTNKVLFWLLWLRMTLWYFAFVVSIFAIAKVHIYEIMLLF